MEKKDVKTILMSFRTSENGEIINKLLGKIDMMDDISLQNAVAKVGGTEDAVRNFFEKKITERRNNNTRTHTPINEMFSYGISDDCVHLHLPTDLHQMISKKGISGTIDTVNLYLLDAIERIKTLRDNGYYKFQEKDSIYMISPVLLGRELKFLRGLDFETNTYKKKELNDKQFVRDNPEAMLATHIFGKDKNVGTAKIGFETISSKNWQDKKEETIKGFESKGITLNKNERQEK